MRPVEVFKCVWNSKARKHILKSDFLGTFHQFGYDYEEFETGPGNFSTAIVEMEDGTVRNVPVEMIKFVDKGECQ